MNSEAVDSEALNSERQRALNPKTCGTSDE
jgi:hypothetical protein